MPKTVLAQNLNNALLINVLQQFFACAIILAWAMLI
jgi:hypothetical protein